MALIVPAILPASREDLEGKLARLTGLVRSVQIDIVDGQFAKPATWPYASGEALEDGDMLPRCGEFRMEVDLMVENPEAIVGSWIEAGATRLTIHAESTRSIEKLLSTIGTTYGHDKDFAPGLLSLGLALNINTDISLIEPYVDAVEYVQFMGIAQIGHQGEPFDPRVLGKIHAFRKRHSDTPIQVDGGVSMKTAGALLEAGVSRLVIGSALWKAPDLALEIQKLEALTQQYGIYE